METKKCTKCGEVKSLSMFPYHKNRCKKCTASYNKEFRKSNPEKVIQYNKQKVEYAKKYVHANRETIKEYRKIYNNTNREKIKEEKKQYYIKNCEKIKDRGKSISKTLTDTYLSHILRSPIKDCPSKLIELKREQIKLYRAVK